MAWRDSAGRRITSTCADGIRHWFTVYGAVGLRAPTCQRTGCGAPNPKPLTEDEQAEYDDYMEAIRGRA